MQTLRMGVIGTGLAWQRLHLPAIRELGDRYRVVAVCDIIPSKAADAASALGLAKSDTYSDHHALLDRQDMDVVDILVPISQNYLVSRDAAEAGHDFICEKPLAPTYEQAQEFHDIPKRYGVRVMIAENYKYSEENSLIKRLVEDGEIGDPVYFVMNNVSCFPEEMLQDTYAATEWRQHPDFPGGAFLDAALHDVARVRHIFGPVDKVQAFGRPQQRDFSPYVSVSANMQFISGVVGQYTYWPSGHEYQRPSIGLRIFGTHGEVYLEDKTCGIVNLSRSDGSSNQLPFRPERGYYNELLNYYNALIGTESISVSPEMEFGDVKTVFDILKSLAECRVVAVDAASGPEPPHMPEPVVRATQAAESRRHALH